MSEDISSANESTTSDTDAQETQSEWRHALIVEDSMPLRRMLVKILSTQNVRGIEAANGKEALDALAQHGPEKFSLILCDLMMPVLDGPNFLMAAQKLYSDTLPPILICSSRSDREAVQIVMKLGVAGYILKPFKTGTIIMKLRELFPDLAEAEKPA